jgi:hypothetical protein
MEKQTTVEWLVSQILVEYSTFFNEEGDLVDKPINQFFNAYQGSVDLIKYVQQAKEMHKQEIIDAWEDGHDSFSTRNAEQYYNETFEKL